MKKEKKSLGKLSLKNELTKKELKQVTGGVSGYTHCSDGNYQIGCAPAYCPAAGHGSFLGCS
jgi:bacteriocin-like protein